MKVNKLITAFLITILFSCSHIFGQKILLDGELTDSNGETVKGKVNYRTGKKTPASIELQLPDGASKTYTPNDLKSVTIFMENGSRDMYSSFTVAIDFSSLDLKKLDTKAEPDLVNRTVLLRNLVNGKMNLYGLVDASDKVHYFISKGQGIPTELTYRKYYYSKDNADGQVTNITISTGVNQVKVNESYKNELYNLMRDKEGFGPKDFEKLEYKENELITLVDQYNGESTFVAKMESIIFSFEVKAGLAIISAGEAAFANQIPASLSSGLGVGLHAKIPRTNWAFQNDLRYTIFKSNKRVDSSDEIYEITDYHFNYLKLHTMFRYSFQVGRTAEMYFQGGMLNGFLLKEEVSTKRHFYTSDSESVRDSYGKKAERGLVVGTGVGLKRVYFGIDYELSSGFRFSVFDPTFKTLYLTGTYRF